MGKSNTSCNKAKRVKDDEFYTQFNDVKEMLDKYKYKFEGKVIYCNCDSDTSAFVKYFKDNGKYLKIKELLYTAMPTDFRSPEAIELLKKADIVVTNPPFSLFREFTTLMLKYDKQFLILGPLNAVAYKEVFPSLKDGFIAVINNCKLYFTRPDGSLKGLSNTCWFTTFKKVDVKPLILIKSYNPTEYPKYDNCDVINVNKIKDIPYDYNKPMGVPITIFDKIDNRFTVLGIANNVRALSYDCNTTINGKAIYNRIIIQLKEAS